EPLKLPGRAKLQYNYIGTSKGKAFDGYYLYERYDITDPTKYFQNSNKFIINLTEESYKKFKDHPNVASLERLNDSIGNKEQGLFPKSKSLSWNRDNLGPIYIPKKGATTELTPETLPFYKRLIEVYEGSELGITNKLSVNGTQVLLNGQPTDTYTFKQDYYWMMGDNRHNSLDSRYFGYVPENHVVGKPVFVWFSWDTNGTGIMNKIRWERLFTTVSGDKEPTSYLPYFLIGLLVLFGYNFFKKKRKS
ncbi:MAG TPA: signal peptidase I, partial [Gillisia sp.]|nr:signal peptidase I [Gillisia sp.]